jgi:hypothetical protein
MCSRRLLALALVLGFSLFGTSCGFAKKPEPLDSAALLEIARHYGQPARSGQVYAAGKTAESPKISPDQLETEEGYKSPIKLAFSQRDYDQLEKAAREAREGKGRTFGGVWKTLLFYEAVYQAFFPPKTKMEESDWKVYFEESKAWIAAKPESAAARINLAQGYLGYAWEARGSGYANTVTNTGWKFFAERTALSAATLAEGAKLKEKDPYWFEVLQNVSLAQGWEKTGARELLELAVTFEPTYYHFYREYANYLQPRWYGDEGEVETYDEEVADRVGGSEGDMLYFEIASLVACQCDAEKTALQNFSWARIKSGYFALGQLYGVSERKRNRFASMAYKENDLPAARLALKQIGDKWDEGVWVKREKFDAAKAWASQ